MISIRPVTVEDLAAFYEHQREPAGNAMAGFPARERDAHMAHWAKAMADVTVNKRTIVVNGEVAGHVVCWIQGERRLVGYWLGSAFWGKGIATRALTAFLEEVPERPLHAFVAKHNVGSIRVLEKCGFTPCAADGIGEDEWLMELAPR